MAINELNKNDLSMFLSSGHIHTISSADVGVNRFAIENTIYGLKNTILYYTKL